MRKILLFFIILVYTDIYSQDSLYLLKKDTIFIIYDSKLKDKNIIKKYRSINYLNQKGVKTIYNLLDSVRLKNKKNHYNNINNLNGSIGSTYSCFNCFGLYFIHDSTNKKQVIDSIYKKNFPYKMIYNSNFKKDSITLKDTIQFDKQLFSLFKRRKLNSIIMINENELKNHTVFNFDGSTKMYNELKKLVKEPYYIFILETNYIENKNKKTEMNYYIFNEIYWVAKRFLRADER